MGWYCQIFLLALVTLVSADKSEKILSQVNSRKDNMAECLLQIVSKAYLPAYPKIQISIEAENLNIKDNYVQIVEIFRRSYKNVILELMSDGNGCFDINLMFFFIDSLKSLKYLVQRNQQIKVNILSIEDSANHIIILPERLRTSNVFLEQIFHFCFKQSILNVLVLQENDAGIIFLYTYYPFAENNNCRNTVPRVQNTYSNGSFQHQKPFFEQKTSNLQQCAVKLIVVKHTEFINPIYPSMFDGLILKALAENMNFSIEHVWCPQGGAVIYSPDNMTIDLKMLHNEDGDLIIGGWCTKPKNDFFGSIPYSFDEELIVFKKPDKYNSFDILLFAFDVPTWIMFLISYILNLAICLATKRFVLRSNNSIRLFLITWFLGVLILRSAYEGSLFKVLHNRPSKPIPKNIEGAIKEGYRFVVSNKDIYSGMKEFPNYMVNVGDSNMYAAFQRVDGKFAWIISNKYLTSYKDRGLKYLIAQESLLTFLQCINTPKRSFLNSKFNYQLELMKSHGLLICINRMCRNNKIIKQNEDKKKPKPISLKQLKVAFMLYLTLTCISLLVFGIEQFSRFKHKCMRGKQKIEYLWK